MFVLFAALLAAQTMHERLRESAQQQQQKTVEMREQAQTRETLVNEEAPRRAPSFEPLMRINVSPAASKPCARPNLQDAEIVLMTINQ